MAANFIESGKQIKYILGSGQTTLASGKAVKIGVTVGVILSLTRDGATVMNNVASAQNDVAIVSYEGVYELPKATSLVITMGDALYWDDTNKVLNKTASGNTFAGFAHASAASDATTVYCNLRQAV